MPIYTKFGDQGRTALIGGGVVSKDDLRVEAYGNVDELNAFLGVILISIKPGALSDSLSRIQRDLFVVGAHLATKGSRSRSISPSRIGEIEEEIDGIEEVLPRLTHFVIPGGSNEAALLHLARTICRRAERSIVRLSRKEKINPSIIVYMNRIGDLFFVQARMVNYRKKVPEAIWKGSQAPPF